MSYQAICTAMSCRKKGDSDKGIQLSLYNGNLHINPWFCSWKCLKDWLEEPSNLTAQLLHLQGGK